LWAYVYVTYKSGLKGGKKPLESKEPGQAQQAAFMSIKKSQNPRIVMKGGVHMPSATGRGLRLALPRKKESGKPALLPKRTSIMAGMESKTRESHRDLP